MSKNPKVATKPTCRPHKQVFREIESIRRRHRGILRPEDMVAYAEAHPGSALHGRFEWDQTQAAHEYRVEQARRIVRVYVTFHPSPAGQSVASRTFVSLESDRHKGRSYRLMSEVLDDAELKAQMLDQARRDMISFRRKYIRLSALAGVIDAIAQTLDDIEKGVFDELSA